MKPILLLEINEIPWRLLDRYRQRSEYPHVKRFFETAKSFTSLTVDEGELSPWVTWPSIHRGLPNTKHRVFNLGQDPATFQGTPIWEEYRKQSASIGIFGSLQSWPPRDPGPGGFFVPDTFAHDEKCVPAYLEPIQRFNLDQVAKNGRVVTSNPLFSALNWKFFLSLFRSGVRFGTMFRLAGQLIAERFDKTKVARRSIYQGVLFWDIFRHLYDPRNPPAFTTFFTNHVAAIMHRYWNHLFPEDFPKDLIPENPVHRETMDFAFRVLDDIMREVLDWMRMNPDLTVVFATSMGQNTVIRDEHHGFELTVSDVRRLMHAVGLSEDAYKVLLAMAPQSAVEIADDSIRNSTIEKITSIRSPDGTKIFSVKEIGPSLSITIHFPSREDCRAGKVILPNGKTVMMEEAGIRVWEIEAGTAYHIPEGILAVAGSGANRFAEIAGGEKIPADQIKEKLMRVAGFPS